MKAEHSRRQDLMKLWKMFYSGGRLNNCADIEREIDKFKTAPAMHKLLKKWAKEWDIKHQGEPK